MQNLIPTQIEGFDEAIGGGIPQGHIVLLRGAAGTMKTTLAYYVAHQSALSGQRALYATLEQSARAILEQMHELGLDIKESSDNLHFLDLSKGREQLSELAASSQWIGVAAALGEPPPDLSTGIEGFYTQYQQGYPQFLKRMVRSEG